MPGPLKTFKVVVGGREHQLGFSRADANALYDEFCRNKALTLVDLLTHWIGGLRPDGRVGHPTDPTAQTALVQLALQRGSQGTRRGASWTREAVCALIDEHVQAGGRAWDVIEPCWKLAYYSGAVTGTSIDWDAPSEDEGSNAPNASGVPAD